MQDPPDPDQLLAAVLRFVRDTALPQLDASAAFEARIACHLLQTVNRQLAVSAADNAAETARLQALLGPCDDDLPALNRALCARIADGRFDAADPALVDHLWASTLAKLAVDKPDYSTYQRVIAAAPTQAPGNPA